MSARGASRPTQWYFVKYKFYEVREAPKRFSRASGVFDVYRKPAPLFSEMTGAFVLKRWLQDESSVCQSGSCTF